MLAAAPVVAPAAPAIGLTGALWLIVMAWVVVWGTLYAYDYTLGAFLREIADATRGIRWIGGKIASAFEAIDQKIQEALGDGLSALETAAATLWDALAYVVRETGDALVAYAADIHDAIHGLIAGEIPTQIGAKTKPLTDRLSGSIAGTDARLRAEALARQRGIDATSRDLTAEALARERGIDRINTRLGEFVIPRIRAIEQGLSDVIGYTRRNLNIRLRTLEKALAAGTLGAIAVAAVTRVFPYWQCTNVRAFNRALCRSPIGSLGWLFGIAALTAVALNPEEIAELGQDLTRGLSDILERTAA